MHAVCYVFVITILLLPTDSNDFEVISRQVLSFTTLDSEKCFNVSITDDSECEYNKHCEDEMFMCVLETEEDSRVIAVNQFASVYIQDGDDCGMHVLSKLMLNDLINIFSYMLLSIEDDTVFFAEGINSSCTAPGIRLAPDAMMAPSQTTIVMDDSSPKENNTTTLVWVLVSVIGLVTFLAIAVVAGITLSIICKKRKKQELTEFTKSRSATLLCSCC